MPMYLLRLFFAVTLITQMSMAMAGIVVGGTRVIFMVTNLIPQSLFLIKKRTFLIYCRHGLIHLIKRIKANRHFL
ncbi:TPA: hypothetical protein HNN98_25870 [Escherichia coli]|nr:hypothetical protein [Escherichia coli]